MSIFFCNSRRALCALALVVGLALVAGAASLSPLINVDLSGSVTRAGKRLSLEEAGRVKPREVISWDMKLSNRGDAPASNVQAVGQVPQGTEFVGGSASGDVVGVKYSLDGKSFSERPMIRVRVAGVDKEVPASPDKYVAVQFTFANVAAGQVKNAAYLTRVR